MSKEKELIEGIETVIKKYVENIPSIPEKGISEFEYYYGGLPQAILSHLKKEGWMKVKKNMYEITHSKTSNELILKIKRVKPNDDI